MPERVLCVSCLGERLIAVLSEPNSTPDLGIIVIPGGPQYRVGSHRHFVRLARRLASEGFAVLRFDPRGRGDSAGCVQGFERIMPDIAAAMDALRAECPSVRDVVLWGLCDAASAALLYYRETADIRVSGMVLVNPWIHSEMSLARTHLKHYYYQRIFDRRFWASVIDGRRTLVADLKSLAQAFRVALGSGARAHAVQGGFRTRMAEALEQFAGPVLILLSEHDWTAREFVEHCNADKHWHQLIRRPNRQCVHLAKADHTFSCAVDRNRLETATLDWLVRAIASKNTQRPQP